ncbi:MAG: Extracellular ligand-binding receptor [Hyphomicrobiales bacterium]|nr:Extracellular ligand-binding receptor [Hyphomicrobiales bacterium]
MSVMITKRAAFALGVSLLAAGCGPTNPGAGPNLSAPTTPVESQALTAPIGSGETKVALILPLTQGSGPSVVGQSLRNAAELAIAETGAGGVTLIVKDDQSTPDGARAAAQAALAEGADMIVGPLYAPNVREVGRIARAAGKPVIGFSTDTSTASRGVYLLSFLVESYVDRIVDFAISKGKKSFAALVPESDYGNVALAEFQQVAAKRGVRIQAIERYQPGNAAAAVKKIAEGIAQVDSLFIPEQAEAMVQVSQFLGANGIDSRRVQILGTGLWNDARVLKLPALQGAWFAAPDNGGFNAFAGRYREKYGSDPTRIATLAYDAVSLAGALARTQGSQRFSDNVLTNSSGFNGADGVFRFTGEGLNERGLSVLSIANGSTGVVSPAPRSFTGQASGT